jgi:hypothetical protein
MPKRVGLWVAILMAVFIAAIVYSTMNLKRFRAEVCMEFQGRTACRIAAAATREQAVRTATENACALISSGMTDSMACAQTPPRSVRMLTD